MITKIKRSLFVLASVFTLLAPATATIAASAAPTGTNNIVSQVCTGAQDSSGQDNCPSTGTGDPSNTLSGVASTIIKYFSYIVGVIAIIFILYGGFRYITSGGDSSKVTTAKNAIIYAIIGLIIVALAQFIVNFVLGVGQSAGNAAS